MSASPPMRSPRTIPDSWRTVGSRLWKAIRAGTLPRDLLICGAAGTGKTYSILSVLHCLARDNRDLRILFCRATRSALTESVLVTYEQEILPLDGMQALAANCQRRVRQAYRYPGGSEIVLGGLDNPTKVLSTAWDVVFVNEAIETQEEAWESILSRMNRPGRRSRLGYLLGDTNPGHPSHWLRARCERGLTAYWDTKHEANPAMFDGRGWTEAGRAYLATLDKLTGTRRARLRDGLWAVGEGLWFDGFDPTIHVTEAAEHDPALAVFLGVDPGVTTGAVAYQIRESGPHRFVTVFADYLAENKPARENARAIKRVLDDRAGGRLRQGYCDPAGGARNPIGPTVLAEYAAEKLPLKPWAATNPSVADSLANVESLLMPVADGRPLLTVHPRCKGLIQAFLSYKRARRKNQWCDYPEDPQHPAEDLIDSLRGGLWPHFHGRKVLRFL